MGRMIGKKVYPLWFLHIMLLNIILHCVVPNTYFKVGRQTCLIYLCCQNSETILLLLLFPAPHLRGRVRRDNWPDAQTRCCLYKTSIQIILETNWWSKDKWSMQLYSPPPVGNLRKLQLKWRGPLQITEIINQAMVRIKEINVTTIANMMPTSANFDWQRNLENNIWISWTWTT